MIKIAFEGGLGNQMFQYTMGRYLQLKFNEPVTYDISRYIFENDEIRDFELLNFNTDYLFHRPVAVLLIRRWSWMRPRRAWQR